MKKRIFTICLFVGLGFLVWNLWLPKNTTKAFRSEPVAQDAPKSSGPQPNGPGVPSSVSTMQQHAVGGGLDELRGLARLANRPIEFYGLVIDQDGNPIPGVKVAFQVRVMKEPLPGAIGDLFDDIATTSDASGRFSLTNAKGSVLTVKTLEKKGYQPSSKATNRSYRYWDNEDDRFKPDAVQPEVFRMWKRVGAEPLVRRGISAPLRYDGTAATFDLLGGNMAGSGDLRVTLVRNPGQITYGQRNYEWTFTVEVLNGGLVETNDEQMYRAPAEGYQPKMVIHMPADATDWTDEKSFNLYLKLHGGQQYGRAEFKVLVGSDRQTTPFYITSFINLSGSRNLEYDPLQDMVESPSAMKP